MKRYLPFIIIVVVLFAAIALAWGLWPRSNGPDPNTITKVSSTPSPVTVTIETERPSPPPSVEASTPRAKSGSVMLEEYGDYQCPPCGQLYPELKRIEEEFGSRLQIVFHQFPLVTMHRNALAAARAAEAAKLQNKFWQMHDRLYRNQDAWKDLPDPRPTFISYATQLGLNLDQFRSDMESFRVDQAISADVRQGQAIGVTGTPTVVIEGRQLSAQATTPTGIRTEINAILQRKSGGTE